MDSGDSDDSVLESLWDELNEDGGMDELVGAPVSDRADVEEADDDPSSISLCRADSDDRGVDDRGVDDREVRSGPQPATTTREMTEQLERGGLDRRSALQQALGLVGKDDESSSAAKRGKRSRDVVYKKRAGERLGPMLPKSMRDKSWLDVDKERAERRALGWSWKRVVKRAEMYRKMVVRSVATMDEYQFEVLATHSLTETLLPSVTERAQKAKDAVLAKAEAAMAGGDDDVSADKTEVRALLDQQATLQGNVGALGTKAADVSRWADENHDLSKEVVAWDKRVQGLKKQESLYAGPMARDLPDFMSPKTLTDYDERVAEAMARRSTGRDHHAYARGMRKTYQEWGLTGPTGFLGKAGAKATRTGKTGIKKGKAGALEALTAGLLSTDEVDRGDGKGTKTVLVINGWVKEFQQVRAQCAEIEAQGVYGDKTKTYTALKTIAEFHIPVLRKISNAILYWATGLAFLTVGGTLGVAAGAGTISLMLSGLKAAVELVLTVWSAAKVHQHTDTDARALKLAQAERMTQGLGLIQDTATAVIGGTLATRHDGGGMRADKAVSKRFGDFDASDKTHYGSVKGTRGMGATGVMAESGMSGKAARGMAESGVGAKSSLVGSVGKVPGDTGDTDKVGAVAKDVKSVGHAVNALA